MKKIGKILVVMVILLLINLAGFIPKKLHDNSETNSNFQDGPTPIPSSGDKILLHTYDFEDQIVGQDPTYETFSIYEFAGDVYIDDLGDGQQKHMAINKVDYGFVYVIDYFSTEGKCYVSGEYHLKVYHDNSGFGIHLNSATSEWILAMIWLNGEIRDNVGGNFLANYTLNQWIDVIIYFDLNVGWMFDLNGVRYGAGYSFPFFGAFTGNAEHIWITSFISGGGDGYFRVDDICAYYNIINIFSPLNQTYTNAMEGYYPATYGFENDPTGAIDENIAFIDYGPSSSIILDELDGHKKVLQIYRSGWACTHSYFAPTFEGTVEMWIRVDDSNEQQVMAIGESFGPKPSLDRPAVLLTVELGNIYWSNNVTNHNLISDFSSDVWYHLRIDVFSNNFFDVYLNQNLAVSKALAMYNMTTGMNCLFFKEYDGAAKWYVDAVGYSWDQNYNIRDNLYEGLLVSADTEIPLESMSYSLDSQPKRAILGNTTIPMPEDGLHTIQIFGVDIFGTHYQSDIRYFTVDFPINIITPEKKTYKEPMTGYFPGTFGFEDVPDDSLPSYCYYEAWGTSPDWTNSYTKVIGEKTDGDGNKHNKVLVLNDLSSGSACASNLNFTKYGSEIARDCTIEFYFCIRTTGSIHYVSRLSVDGNYGPLFTFNFDSWSSLNDPEILYVNSSGQFSTGLYQKWDKWYRYSVDISCDGGYAGLGANQFRFRIYNDTGNMIYTSYATDFQIAHPTGGPNRCRMISTQSQTQLYEYLDAFSITGLQDNYEIGDNLNEGLLLSFENNTNFDWMGYSLDGQTNKTILGNTTISLPKDGLHLIRVYGNDSLGTMYQSNIRHFSVHHINIITPEDQVYNGPMSGYYPATYGFESEKDGMLPRDFINLTMSGCDLKVISELDGHKKILDLDDPVNYGHVSMRNNLIIPQAYGTMEFWVRSTDINKPFQFEFQNSSLNVFAGFQLMDSAWRGLNPSWTIIPALGTPLVNNWHHIRIDFECTVGNYTGLSQYTLRYTVDSTLSAILPFLTNCSQLDTILYWTSISNYNYHIYLDALSFSWDPNYNIGDNLNEGLLLSYENSTALNWTGYSLDGQPTKTILGNSTVPFPNDGSHCIQIFGNDTLGNIYSSENRFFAVNTGSFFDIDTPENKTYYAPMSGYYPATFGFEVDDINSYPKGWISVTNGGTIRVHSKFGDHNKVIELNDTNGSDGNELINQINDVYEGVIEFWMGTDNVIELNEIDIWDDNDTNWGIQLGIQSSKFQYKKSDENWYDIPYVGAPINNKLHHWKIEFNCSTYKFHVFIDGIDSGELDFKTNHNSFDRIQFHTSDAGSGFSMYVDAVGFSWDPYYNIGDNIHEGLYLSYTQNSELNWIDYSLNGQSNRTIFGNTTIPFSNLNIAINFIQLFGEDFRGILYESIIRYFEVSSINIITPENITYTKPMSGYYPATYGFENDIDGTYPKKWNTTENGGVIQIISEKDGHKKVAEIHETSDSLNELENIFSNPQETGTIEYFFMVNRIDDMHDIGIISNDSSHTDRIQIIVANDGYLKYHDASWIPIMPIEANRWYHLKIEFNCSEDWHLWIDGVSQDNGLGYPIYGDPNNFDRLMMRSSDFVDWKDTYIWIDAVGYSWDPNYNIGDNLYEGLLLSYENRTILDWQGYSLDGHSTKTILGNTTILMPENGLHNVQVFGNDSLGFMRYSPFRYFTVQYFPIDIVTPENKTYYEPMSGYYPATYGFENDEDGTFPNDWYTDVAYGGTCEVINNYYNHKKIVNLTDMVLENQTQMKNELTNKDNGTIEFYYLIDDSNKRNVFCLYENDTADGIYLRVDTGYLAYRTDIYYNIFPILSNTWYHISITFNSTADKFWITINGTLFGGTSGYDYRSPNTMMRYFEITSSISHADYSFYIDAVGYSWDPNYNIGDNLNEGLLLSFKNEVYLNWQGYSLDFQPINTILGNTTIPIPSEGLHTIQVIGNDILGITRYSKLRYFTFLTDIFPPNIIINSPLLNALFGSVAPFFNLTILDLDLNTIWYTFDGGLINLTITWNFGYLDQTEWDKIGNGTATIKFYANDTIGNVGFEEVAIRKDIISPDITIFSPSFNDLFGDTAPSFNFNIIEPNLDSRWYTLDGGVTVIPISGSTGTIQQIEWDKFSNGTVIIRFYANDSVGNSGWEEVTVRKDVLPPEITVNSPINNQIFTESAPNFDLTVNEGNLEQIWYTLDDGLINRTCGPSGQIIQAYWNALPPGDYTLRFYAKDTLGHEGFAEVIVSKRESPAIPGYNIIMLSLIMIIAIISITWQIKKKSK